MSGDKDDSIRQAGSPQPTYTVVAYATSFPDQPFIPSQPAPTTEPQVLLLLRQLQTDVAELRQSHATMLKAVETFLEKMRPPEAYRNPKRKKSQLGAKRQLRKLQEKRA